MENKGSATANKSVNFTVTNNLALTKLHTTGDLIKNFTVTGNDALTELDMTGLKTRGTDTTGATVNLWDNDLTAVKSTDTTDAETATSTTGADGGSADVGTTDDGVSGMDTMKIYLTAIAADVKTTAQVNFDTVSTFDDSETSTTATTLNTLGSTSNSSTTNDATVLKMTAATANSAAAAKTAIAAIRGFVVAAASTVIKFNTPNEAVTIPASAYTLLGNNAVDAANIASTANKDLATTLGITLDAYNKGNSYATVSLVLNENTNIQVQGERYTSVAAATAASTITRGSDGTLVHSASLSDTVTLSVGANSVTTSLNAALVGGGLAYTGTATTLGAMEIAILAAWGAKYGTTGTASASAIATLVANDHKDGIIHITALQTDSGGHDMTVSFAIGDSGSAVSSQTATNIDYVIGATKSTGDNSTIATSTKAGLIIKMVSNTSGTDLDKVTTTAIVDASTGASLTALSTDYTTNTAWAKVGLVTGTTIERTDVRTAEDSVDAATSNAVAATKFNRVTWLG
jgi:hypothetical protein